MRQPEELEFQGTFVTFLDFAKELKIKNLLSDNRLGINITLGMQRWTAEICAAYIQSLHVERYARIVQQDAFQQLVTYKMHDALNAMVYNQVDVRLFTTYEMGYDWLVSAQTLTPFISAS
ncbi:hypothetical protein ACSX1A_07295 [Pontibacter sp. MBLB2868]|uniref:hypothetical protein n=1 Tax=Pontibacter sp. MBLB2868 TaxID=3451555 RepID=UPI003F75286E